MVHVDVPQQRPRETLLISAEAPSISAATRHMAAAAYLDADFRYVALTEVHDNRKRLVAPSFGFDLIAVLKHCRRAANIDLARDIVLTAVSVFCLCVFPLAAFAIVAGLINLQLTVALVRFGRDAFRELRNGDALALNRLRLRGMVVLMGFLAYVTIGTLIWVVIGALLFNLSDFSSGGDGFYENSSAGGFDYISLNWTLMPLLFGILVAAPGLTNVWRQLELDKLVPGKPMSLPPDTERHAEIRRQNSGNTTVYSGFRPFVGSGDQVDTWSFAQRLIRTNAPGQSTAESTREYAAAPFSAVELKNYVAAQLHELTWHSSGPPELQIPGLSIEDRVFVAGSEVTDLAPVRSQQQVNEIIQHPVTAARHYLACQVVAWRGEVVASVYVHFAVQGRTLYIELSEWALPPCDDAYRVIDDANSGGAPAYLLAIWRGFLNSPRHVLRAPINIGATVIKSIVNANAAGAWRPEHGYDYGARISLRELASSPLPRNYMQVHDVQKYTSIVERRVLAAVYDFLEFKGVDTSEYRQRALTILNNGVMNTGGTTNISQSSVGQSAQTHNTERAGV